jgi:hypothetical protein
LTRLAHDILAPLIRHRFSVSVDPGQRARRLLENRALEWMGDMHGSVLDSADLAVVESGVSGMRALTRDELRLVTVSKQKENEVGEPVKEVFRRLKRKLLSGASGKRTDVGGLT